MKNFNIKSYCKINLFLNVLKKLKNGYHKIDSLITFCYIYDVIKISKISDKRDKISFSGKFKKNIDKNTNTVTKLLSLLRKDKYLENQFFKIDIKKNIPHGSGLGGGSSNAAYILNYLNLKMKLKIQKKEISKIARKIGFDVPISLEKKNTFLNGKNNKIIRINKKFNFNLLIVYPNLICSTKKVYKKNKKISFLSKKYFFYHKKNKELIGLLQNQNNDLQDSAIKIYPKIKKIIDYIKSQKGCYFSRITGSGSACIGIFASMRSAVYAQKLIKTRYPNYWCVTSKTI